jgi:flagellar hook protein FlgE
MFSAISGLKGHQVMMDVIANNISNVNTAGFKASRVTFQDILSQTMRGATAPNGNLGSINPAQVGLGMTVGAIDVLQTQGNLQSTGKVTDMAILGEGFFVLADGMQRYYSRDGGFDISLDGSLVSPTSGLTVQGWQADAFGKIDTTGPIGNIVVPVGQRTTATATKTAAVRGNLDASADIGTKVNTTLTMYDSLGVRHSIGLTLEKTAANAWSWTSAPDPSDPVVTTASTGTLTFSSDGILTASTGTLSVAFDPTTSGANTPIDIVGDWTAAVPPAPNPPAAGFDWSALTQFAGSSELAPRSDGFTSGTLVTFSVGSSGEVTGVYSNGQTQPLGQIAVATFLSTGGLQKAGQNAFQVSAASGEAIIGTPASGGRGKIVTGSLEMSNVDLAAQFTGMITAQRGFQANSRVITASDEMLQDLVNMKR